MGKIHVSVSQGGIVLCGRAILKMEYASKEAELVTGKSFKLVGSSCLPECQGLGMCKWELTLPIYYALDRACFPSSSSLFDTCAWF